MMLYSHKRGRVQLKPYKTKAKKDKAQTLIRDLMLLNLKDLLASSGSWKDLVSLSASGSGLCTSTTWPLWHRTSSLLSLWEKNRKRNQLNQKCSITEIFGREWVGDQTYVGMRWPLQRLHRPGNLDKADGVVFFLDTEEEHSAVGALSRRVEVRGQKGETDNKKKEKNKTMD